MYKKIVLNDGFIILNDKGNTYQGSLAHKILFMAQKFHREYNQAISFNEVIECCIAGLNNATKKGNYNE